MSWWMLLLLPVWFFVVYMASAFVSYEIGGGPPEYRYSVVPKWLRRRRTPWELRRERAAKGAANKY